MTIRVNTYKHYFLRLMMMSSIQWKNSNPTCRSARPVKCTLSQIKVMPEKSPRPLRIPRLIRMLLCLRAGRITNMPSMMIILYTGYKPTTNKIVPDKCMKYVAVLSQTFLRPSNNIIYFFASILLCFAYLFTIFVNQIIVYMIAFLYLHL